MANPFIPFGLKIREVTPASLILDWDLDNTVEFKSGTYYNVYTSVDDIVYTLLGPSNVKYTTIPLRGIQFYIAITSIVIGMGESEKSAPILVEELIGASSNQDSATIAVTSSGDPVKLKTAPDGSLAVSLSAGLPGGLATEGKQDTGNTTLSTISSTATTIKNDLAALKIANHTDLEVIETKIDALNTAVVDSLAISNLLKIVRSSATCSDVDTAGVSFILPWKKKSVIHQITVLKKFGSATSWVIEIIEKSGVFSEENVVIRDFSYNSYDPLRYDILKNIPYINIDGADSIIIRLTADAGASNVFYVAISGEEAR